MNDSYRQLRFAGVVKNEIPLPALAISYLGTITSFVTEAKSIIGALAALASLVASLYAIAIARKKMKRMDKEQNPFRKHAPAILIGPLMLMLCGCSTIDLPPGKTLVSQFANIPTRILDKAAELVTTTTTNIVEQIVATQDLVPSASLESLSPQSSVLSTNYFTNITVATPPALAKGVAVAETAATFLPPPWGEAAAGGLALVSALLASAMRRRNAMLKTVIQGVENSGSKEAKTEIRDLSQIVGLAKDIHSLVKKNTD